MFNNYRCLVRLLLNLMNMLNKVLLTKYETGVYRGFRGWTVHPSRRISILPELLRDIRLPTGSIMAISCLSGILIEAGNSEPQPTRMTEVYDVIKEFAELVTSFCEEVGPGVTIRLAPPLYRSKPTWFALSYAEIREVR
jgi:hypothetical protein